MNAPTNETPIPDEPDLTATADSPAPSATTGSAHADAAQASPSAATSEAASEQTRPSSPNAVTDPPANADAAVPAASEPGKDDDDKDNKKEDESAPWNASLKKIVAGILTEFGDNLADEVIGQVAKHLDLQHQARAAASVAPTAVADAAARAPEPAVQGNVATVAATPGQAMQMSGGAAIADGLGTLLGSTLNLAGTAGKAVGNAAQSIAQFIKPKEQTSPPAEVVGEAPASASGKLFDLSEYRIAQTEKASKNFSREADAFWSASPKIAAVRAEVERLARERGLPLQDVVEKMKPGGDFAQLRETFNAAVSENPDAKTRKKAMDKALENYVKQYGRAQTELLSAEQDDNPHYDRYKERLHHANSDILDKASSIPAFANDKGILEPSHFERLKEAIARISKEITEFVRDVISKIRGKPSSDHEGMEP
jgi:hypothetical protein